MGSGLKTLQGTHLSNPIPCCIFWLLNGDNLKTLTPCVWTPSLHYRLARWTTLQTSLQTTFTDPTCSTLKNNKDLTFLLSKATTCSSEILSIMQLQIYQTSGLRNMVCSLPLQYALPFSSVRHWYERTWCLEEEQQVNPYNTF